MSERASLRALSNNVDEKEIEKFSALASRWWDTEGEFKPLHQINPLRLTFIEQQVGGLFNKHVVDVGCGGGLLTEGMASRGARVTGIDLAHDSLEVARLHALESQLSIDYQQVSAENFAAENSCISLNNGNGWDKTYRCVSHIEVDQNSGKKRPIFRGDCANPNNLLP